MTQELQLLLQKLEEEYKNLAEDMVLGKSKDFTAYQYSCGIARGYLLTKGYISEIAERLERGEE